MDESTHTVVWRRLDLSGHEACRLTALGFVASVEVDDVGLVTEYGEIWVRS